MSDNTAQNAANEPEEAPPRDVVENAFLRNMAEITHAQAGESFLTDGLQYLKELSGDKLEFCKLLTADLGNRLLETELEKKNEASVTTLRLKREGEILEIFTNAGAGAAASTASDTFVPSEEDKAYATGQADEDAMFMGHVSDEAWQELYDKALESVRISMQRHSRTTAVSTPATADEALAALAKEAVLQEFVTAVPEETDNLMPAQKAIVDGLRRGVREREGNLLAVKYMAEPFLSGLELLEKLSNGQIKVSPEMLPDGSAMEIKIAPPPAPDGNDDKSGTTYLKVHGDGVVRWAGGWKNYIEQKYDAMDEQHITDILTAIAEPAVFAGKIPSTVLRHIDTSGPEQKTVLAVIRKAEEDRVNAHIAASNLTDGLEILKGKLPGHFDYTVEESPDTAEVIVVLNPGKRSVVDIPVDADGTARYNGTEYKKVDEPAGRNAALTAITDDVMAPLTWRGKPLPKPSL